MPSSFIPQRIKRAKQQITVKLYQDQLAMLDKDGRFIDDSRDCIISQALELVFKWDKEFTRWVEQQRNAGSSAKLSSPALNLLVQHHCLHHSGMREKSVLAQMSWARCKQNQHRAVEDRVVRRAVDSRNLVSFVVSTAVGTYLFRNWPFPAENDLLQMVLLQKPYLFYGIKYGFVAMLFSTPYIAFSILFSFTYIFVMRREEQIMVRRLAPYLPPESRNDLYLVVGELHHPKRSQPAAAPRWLIVPERGPFTGIAIFGAVGSGKTTGCMYPFAEQVLAYCADEAERRVSGLVLEVKGDFCHKVRRILEKHGRADDYVEISLASSYRYNPLHNELEAYALA